MHPQSTTAQLKRICKKLAKYNVNFYFCVCSRLHKMHQTLSQLLLLKYAFLHIFETGITEHQIKRF